MLMRSTSAPTTPSLWAGRVARTDVYQMFHSTQIEGGGDNFVHFENADALRMVSGLLSMRQDAI